jgi:S1-C subfamily serine protease
MLFAAAMYFAAPALAGPAQSSVWIEVTRADEVKYNGVKLPRNGEGMGVAIAKHEIATAAHVVLGAKTIVLTDAHGGTASAEIAFIDRKVDVAILKVEEPRQYLAPIRLKPAATGERVIVVELERPNGDPVLTAGAIAAAKWTAGSAPVPLIFSGIKGEKGMSGGGLFDANGRLLGIVIRIDSTLGYLSALPVAELCSRSARCAVLGR